MNRTIAGLAALLLASCTQQLRVEVTNPTQTERTAETVTISWAEVAPLCGVTPENVVVADAAGNEIPSQVIYAGEEEPQALIFQVDAPAGETSRFTVRTGVRADYPSKAYGRYVPERLDDYAWENDRVAFRAYGPALETAPGEMLATPGFDTWVKSTDELVIDLRYKRGNYHHDYGDGMDCYKVGRTLGAGASAPLTDGRLWLSRNYATQRTLDNGPIRTTVRFEYAPFEVAGRKVSLVKVISLDAGSHFNRIENIYEGDFEELPIASGFVRHDVKHITTGDGWMGLCEAASDSKQPEEDGDIYLGIVQPGAAMLADTLKHAVAVELVKPGQRSVYYAGTGWSKGGENGVADMEGWKAEIEKVNAAATAPLQVKVGK